MRTLKLLPLAGVAIVLIAGCSTVTADPGQSRAPAVSDAPTASPSPIPSRTPRPSATPVATPTPTAEPTVKPTPVAEAPTEAPEVPTEAAPSEDPMPLIVLPTNVRATHDEVAVHDVPGLGTSISAWLSTGDLLEATLGPIILDDHAWYLAAGDRSGRWVQGWVSSRYLAADPTPVTSGRIGGMSGVGQGGTMHHAVQPNTDVTVSIAVGPADGQATCGFDLQLTRTDGTVVKLNGASLITSFVMAGVGRLENGAMHQEAAGDVILDVRSDCVWAVSLTAAPSTH